MDATRKGDDLEEVEIDLGEPNDPGEFDIGDEAQRLWKAVPILEEEEDIHTSAMVEISDTKPLIDVRDPRGINDCLKVTFEDVIAEPVSVRSGDRVWIWSHALFEVSRVWIYRIITAVLAIPLSVASGILFAILSCFHIWMVGPCVQAIVISTSWLQRTWSVLLDLIVRPLFLSVSRCCRGFSIHLAEE
ncbi:caveolin-2 [Takifugu rubripes]|uniref:Caveolin n=1 Tax=Takifugu rubripes TaxID=31033 RepID=H2T3A1_TAKRU|nr:caveolin-2-like [Takifugu rubripes]XP_029683143.1 caveolin-2-like [Takifugu rubripes]